MEKYHRNWHRLDNAAKIFPPNSRGADTKVFRFTCQLKENVDEGVLNMAISLTIKEIPAFNCVLRHGLFWYYFEESDFKFKSEKETTAPCLPLYFDAASPLLRINHHGKRINFEVYHALTDGAGALQFLKVLVCKYIDIKYADELVGESKQPHDLGCVSQQHSDSFDKYFSGIKGHRAKGPTIRKAYQLKGKKRDFLDMAVIEGVVSAKQLSECAKKNNCTITEFLCAVMILTVRKTINVRDRKYPVVISVPVNLRRFFPSRSVRNFFSVFNVGYDMDNNETDLKKVAGEVHKIISCGLNEEFLQKRLDDLENLERKLYTKLVPLFIKNPVLHYYYLRSEKEYTTTISNMGNISLLPQYAQYVDRFSVFNSTKDLQACVCSFEDKLCFTFTSRMVSTEIEMEFFRFLSQLGVETTIYSNLWE